MSTTPVTLDMTTAQPISTQPVQLDMSTAQPLGKDQANPPAEAPSFLGSLGGELKGMGSEGAGMAKGMATTVFPGQGEAVSNIKAIPAIYHAYETARSQGKGVMDAVKAADDVARQQDGARNLIKQRAKEFADNPSEATGKTIMDLIPLALGFVKGAPAEAAAPETAALETPGLVKQLVKGRAVAQPGAVETVRGGVQASTEAAGTASDTLTAGIKDSPVASPVEGKATILDEPLKALKEKESTAYKQVDDTAGFDVKAEKQQLSNDQYKLKQLGNTPEDVAAREKITRSIKDSQNRIAEAEGRLQKAGIDPKAADKLHQQRMAGNDFKKVLAKNTNADGSLNVDGLLRDSKNLRFTKNGDRLSQFMGSDASNQYLTRLSQMQKLGAHAVKTQAIAKWVGAGVIGAGALTEGVAKVMK